MLKGEKSPQEDTYLKYLKADSKDDLNKRIDHIRLLTAKLGNKVSNIERAEILKDLNELKKKYIKSDNEGDRRRVINKIVKITNDLYNLQKQHTKLQHDQTYFGLKDLKYLFDSDVVNYEAIFVRSALTNRFEKYEKNPW